MAVNEGSALRKPWTGSCEKIGKGVLLEQTRERAKKNERERVRRDGERSQVERMSRLFRMADPEKTWTRVEILSFGEAFFFLSVDLNDRSPDSFQRCCSSFGVPAPSRRVSFVQRRRHKGCKQMMNRTGLDFSFNSLFGQIPCICFVLSFISRPVV